MTPSHGTVLVTGAAGFVGSCVAARLAQQGWQVAACDNFNDYYTPRLKRDRVAALLAPNGIVCHEVELAERDQVERLFQQVQPDCVVHLAAQAGVRYSLDNPDVYVQSNLVAFSHMLEACRRWQPRHLVYASSSSVYGAGSQVPFREDDRTDAPLSLYAATKKANEVMAHAYSQLFALPATGLRFFTAYGPWGRPDMAYFRFAHHMARGEPIPVYGAGQLRRDFTYIDDLADAVVRVLALAPPAGVHRVLNIGSERPVPLPEFIAALEQALGMQARLALLPMQPGDMVATCADTGRLRALIGPRPITTLASGLERFAAWFADHGQRYTDPKPCAIPHAGA
jgi:UDP-glucuronate 4-epimerase